MDVSQDRSLSALAFLLEQLKVDSDKLKLLRELKSALLVTEFHPLKKDLQLTELFQCLFSNDKEEVELCCEVLHKLLAALNPEVVMGQYSADLVRGLTSNNLVAKEFAIKQIGRCVQGGSENKANLVGEDVLLAIINTISDESIGLASRSRELLELLSRSSEDPRLPFSSSAVKHLKDLTSLSDIVRLRVHELVVNMSKESETRCQQFISCGLLPLLVEDVNSDDILVQLNCLELLSELAMAGHGFTYLENSGVVAKVERMMFEVDSSPLVNLLLPGLMKFFGCAGHRYPKEICGNYRGFVHKVFNTICGEDLVLKGIAIETLAILGSSVDGKLALEKLGNRMTSCLGDLARTIASSPVDTRVKAIGCAESLLNLNVFEQTCELTALTKTWFSLIFGETAADIILGLCRQPFLEPRHAALRILYALAKQEWGQTFFKGQPGFIEYVLDRTTVSEKIGKELKYDIVKALAESATSETIFGNVLATRFKEYVKEGPFHVQAQTQVALDDAQ